MERHNITIITDKLLEECSYIDCSLFDVICITDPAKIPQHLDQNSCSIVVLDYSHDSEQSVRMYQSTRDIARQLEEPLVMMCDNIDLKQKLDSLEAGFDDIIPLGEPVDEISTRLLRAIYHCIANRQLKQQLNSASEAALAAMRESSNLGSNVHFLVQAHQCNNLDELGQIFFRAMSSYGLNCSLQMRSAFGEKDMEANGMPRPLESELLTQLKDTGRYFDFGQRSVVNYGQVSVLIRNMPKDESLYGLVKDNTFTLLQGMDARVRSLDEHEQLAKEKNALERLSGRLNLAIQGVNGEYRAVMLGIVEVVENMAEQISDQIPLLLLNEDQEQFIEKTIGDCVLGANKVFSEGFKVDQHFTELQQELEEAIKQVKHSEPPAEIRLSSDHIDDSSQDIELF